MQQFERFHLWIGVEAVVIGAVVATVWWAFGRARGSTPMRSGTGRLLFASIVIVVDLVVRHYVFATPAVAALVVVSVIGAVSWREDWPVVGVMALVSLAGVWSAVPDTEVPLIVLGILVVPALVGRRAVVVDRLAAILLVVGSAWVGSAGVTVLLVGGVGCVGLLATLPAFAPGIVVDRRRSGWWPVLLVHAVVVATSSRVLTRTSVPVAIAGVVAILVGAFVAGVAIDRRLGTVSAPGSPSPASPAGRR